jgi:hypothetical protein
VGPLDDVHGVARIRRETPSLSFMTIKPTATQLRGVAQMIERPSTAGSRSRFRRPGLPALLGLPNDGQGRSVCQPSEPQLARRGAMKSRRYGTAHAERRIGSVAMSPDCNRIELPLVVNRQIHGAGGARNRVRSAWPAAARDGRGRKGSPGAAIATVCP